MLQLCPKRCSFATQLSSLSFHAHYSKHLRGLSGRKWTAFICSESLGLAGFDWLDFFFPPSLSLRVFSDPANEENMWKASVKDIDGEILCVSQFTLLANTTKGNKPDFHRAMVGSPSFSLFFLFFLQVSSTKIPSPQSLPGNCTPHSWRPSRPLTSLKR